jgi:hypothetical protein
MPSTTREQLAGGVSAREPGVQPLIHALHVEGWSSAK